MKVRNYSIKTPANTKLKGFNSQHIKMKNTTTAIVAFSFLPLLPAWQRNCTNRIHFKELTEYLGVTFSIGLFYNFISSFRLRALETPLTVISGFASFHLIKNYLVDTTMALKRQCFLDG